MVPRREAREGSADHSMTHAPDKPFLEERRRARRFFNRVSAFYPVVERHLSPQYREALCAIDLPRELSVLDLATGTGLLAGAFSERGHPVTGLDFADELLGRARRRFPRVDFRHLDLLHLDRIDARAYDVVSMGYVLHGLSPGFRHFVLSESARIARTHVLVFDYCRDGGWVVRLIEWVEGPHYPLFIAEDREREFRIAGLQPERVEQVSELGSYWLCVPGP